MSDVIKFDAQGHSNLDKSIVERNSYQVKGSLSFVEILSNFFYSIQLYNNSGGPTRKYTGKSVFDTSNVVFPSDPLDNLYVRYFNHSHLPIPSPLE